MFPTVYGLNASNDIKVVNGTAFQFQPAMVTGLICAARQTAVSPFIYVVNPRLRKLLLTIQWEFT